MSSPAGIVGFSLAIATGGFLGSIGNMAGETSDSKVLDAYLEVAGGIRAGAANAVMHFTETFIDFLEHQEKRGE